MAKETLSDFDEPLTPDVAEEKGGKFKKVKKLLIIIVPILLLVIAGLYFFFFVIHGPKTSDVAVIQQGKEKQPVELEQNTYLDLDPITVGLTPTGSKREYLKLGLTFRLASEAETVAVMDKVPMIKDSLITLLRSLRASDFNSSSSTIYLKEEITKRINKITAPIVIKEVLFQELTVN